MRTLFSGRDCLCVFLLSLPHGVMGKGGRHMGRGGPFQQALPPMLARDLASSPDVDGRAVSKVVLVVFKRHSRPQVNP